MAKQYSWIKNKKYYLYSKFPTWEQALKVAKYYRKKNKCRYFILKKDGKYCLYLDKVIKFG